MDALIHATDELFSILKDTTDELSITNPTMVTCMDLLHMDVSDIGKGVSRNTYILDSLRSLHSKIDKIPASPPTFELDAGEALFHGSDHATLKNVEKKLGDISSDVEGVNAFLTSFGLRSSTTDGEKTKAPVTEPPVHETVQEEPAFVTDQANPVTEHTNVADESEHALQLANEPLVPGNTKSAIGEASERIGAPIHGEGTSIRTPDDTDDQSLDEIDDAEAMSEGEKRKDKSKKPMTFAEQLADMKLKKAERIQRRRESDADTLKLKPAFHLKASSDIPAELLLSNADREIALKANFNMIKKESF